MHANADALIMFNIDLIILNRFKKSLPITPPENTPCSMRSALPYLHKLSVQRSARCLPCA